ncbi:MAG: ABC transporter substrate-binding protein [Aggregatilineales bacterium]
MKNLYRFITVGIAIMMAVSLGLVVSAQDDEIPGPGEGGVVIQGNTRGSANLGPLVPLRCSGVDCADANALLYPSLVSISPQTQQFATADEQDLGQLALSFDISEDGLVYTFNLRDDAFWNDGEPITAEDFYFAWLAVEQGEAVGLSSSYSSYQRDIASAEIIDDYTIAFTLENPSCLALSSLALPATPGHAYGWDVSMGEDFDWGTMIDNPLDDEPTVTAGPFQFFRVEPGTAVFLSANPEYYAPSNDEYTVPEGWVYLDTLDENVLTERFLSFQPGEPNFVNEPGAAQFEPLRSSDAQYFQAPGRTWHYVALNLADPTNPQNGLDADGNPIDQGNHPLFGDVRVRQALQQAIDIEEIINGAQNGDATPMVSGTIPTAFTIHPTLERRPMDLDAARALLDEAGWVSTGDPLVDGGDGLRTCQGCLHAEEGTPFSFVLMNPGTSGREDVSIILQAQFAQLGVDVDPQVLDFNTMYDTNLGGQIYDAAVAGWRGGLPFDPDQRSFWGAETDIFGEGYGFNFPSYYNAEFEELSAAVNQVPGCDLDTRLEMAYRMQEILWEDQPYLYLYALDSAYAVAPNVEGFDPYPNFGNWNLDAWNVTSTE